MVTVLLACSFGVLRPTFFQNLYWADSGDLVTIASDTSFYILKYNVRAPIGKIYILGFIYLFIFFPRFLYQGLIGFELNIAA